MNLSAIETYIGSRYAAESFPALEEQSRRWQGSRPFEGLKLLIATPLFANTLTQYRALLCAGAHLTAAYGNGIRFDPEIVKMLPEFGIASFDAKAKHHFDAVLDCGGVYAHIRSRLGFSELTRSGLYRYEASRKKVFSADSSLIKEIETGLGTGDGFMRALHKLGHRSVKDKRIVVFGCGKVGLGIVLRLRNEGAVVFVADDPSRVKVPAGTQIVDRSDPDALSGVLAEAWMIVSATGIRHALRGMFDAETVSRSETLLVNMGFEDEFGEAFSEARMLGKSKYPFNFILDEPTRLCYLDPTLALHNAGVAELLNAPLHAGINLPSPELESSILSAVREKGIIGEELKRFEQEKELLGR